MPALFVVIGAPIAGLMVDRWGRKPLLVVSIPLYALAGSSGFLLESLSSILVARALLGLAVAGIMTSVTTSSLTTTPVAPGPSSWACKRRSWAWAELLLCQLPGSWLA